MRKFARREAAGSPLSDDVHDDEHVMEMEAYKIAAKLFDATCRNENCHPDFVHSDNGEPMKGITLCAFYYHLGITPGFWRPGVSDDNPYIESFFKTTKYHAGYPKCFHESK